MLRYNSLFPLAEVNTISEHTETLHLSPHITTDLVVQGVEKAQEVCTHSCEELSNMMNELSGLHVMVNQLSKNLERVVGTWWRVEVENEGSGDRQQSVRKASGASPLAASPDSQSGLWGPILHCFGETLIRKPHQGDTQIRPFRNPGLPQVSEREDGENVKSVANKNSQGTHVLSNDEECISQRVKDIHLM